MCQYPPPPELEINTRLFNTSNKQDHKQFAMSSREDKVYARVFKRVAYGFACFKQVPDERLRPGTCGYFDFDGDWHPILQLIEKEEPPAAVGALEYIFSSARRLVQKEPAAKNKDEVPEAEELSAVPALTEHSGEEGPWGPIVSEGVRGSQIDLKVEGKCVNPFWHSF